MFQYDGESEGRDFYLCVYVYVYCVGVYLIGGERLQEQRGE